MLKHLSKTTKLFGALIAIVVVIMVIVMAVSGNKVPTATAAQYVNDNASADNKVEALKTMTADLLAVENNNKQLQHIVQQLQTHNKNAIDQVKKSVSDQMQSALQKMQVQNAQKQRDLEQQLQQTQHQSTSDYPIHGANQSNAFVWVSDVSKSAEKNAVTNTTTNAHHHLFSLGNDNGLLVPSNESDHTTQKQKHSVKPIYTIPMNATLTGATLMTPLVGRIPIDGKLPSPYHFKLILSASNLTANGYPLPGVKGAVMSGIASGDMLGLCARGEVHSITFIFNNGTISTTQAKGSDSALGYISSQTGNPCIAGTFHSNAGLFLSAQMGLAAVGGYAKALSSAQYQNTTTPEGGAISTLIGSANKAAIGQGASSASLAAQTWWNRRVQNSFDYVYVPNVNPKTGKPMKVVVNMTQQIPINYDANTRKVSYEDTWQTDYRELD